MKVNFSPKEWVLVRDSKNGTWTLAQFSHIESGLYVVTGGMSWKSCIPYEGNEDLLSTCEPLIEKYVPKHGDVLITDKLGCKFKIFVFSRLTADKKVVFSAGKDIIGNILNGCEYIDEDGYICLSDYRLATEEETLEFAKKIFSY